jgi:hypothetical protein
MCYNEHGSVFYCFEIRGTDTCTCRVSAGAVKRITFEFFDKFQDAILWVCQYNFNL